jgi:hypothetical protein
VLLIKCAFSNGGVFVAAGIGLHGIDAICGLLDPEVLKKRALRPVAVFRVPSVLK